ncbi:GH16 domain-containing protein [Mycena chlorophos]|uniref:GH16 domain-containing protein n=1 Tax=Mycena chlorophos TaxID=658473 RepID=A0A8H6SZT4_MYCCL|nr:GH16 domain-containing protein [Mycena chlorophos]
MPALSALLLLALPLGVISAPHIVPPHHRRESVQSRATYTLTDHYRGNDFLDWDFFSGPDPTHGTVNYLTKSEAVSKGLAYVQSDNTTILAVDSKSKLSSGQNRDSVRISSPKSYTTGLFIADFWTMPHGPTIWPAYWTVGPNWPNDGEIDIIEGVGDSTTNQMTLHTSSGCSLDTNTKILAAFTGEHTSSTTCASSGSDNNGCGITDSGSNAYGHEFNIIAGGVMAHVVDSSGISIWRFPRNSIPEDITSGNPDPSSWGKPAALFSSATCNIGSHFKDHVLTINTALCGDWAGNAFPGGPSACASAVEDPSNYQTAKWEINYISVYESS